MGLIRVAIDATRQVIQDQYLEFFECPSMPDDVLIVKGHKSTKGNTRNSNIDDVISNGSLIIVNKGQAMAIVDNGAVVEFTAEAGPFVDVYKRQLLDRVLPAERRRAVGTLLGIEQLQRAAAARVLRALSGAVRRQTAGNVVRRAGVERAVAAAQHVDIPHQIVTSMARRSVRISLHSEETAT